MEVPTAAPRADHLGPETKMRDLAQIYTSISAAMLGMEQAVKDGNMFEYRFAGMKRKHAAIDSFSCSMAVQVWAALKPETKAKVEAKFGADVGRFVMAAWKVYGNVSKAA